MQRIGVSHFGISYIHQHWDSPHIPYKAICGDSRTYISIDTMLASWIYQWIKSIYRYFALYKSISYWSLDSTHTSLIKVNVENQEMACNCIWATHFWLRGTSVKPEPSYKNIYKWIGVVLLSKVILGNEERRITAKSQVHKYNSV